MKITRLAQGGGTPPGHIMIECEFDDEGNMKTTVVEHGAGTSCLLEDDDAILEDLLETEVDGHYGDFGQITDAGRTKEYFEEKQKEKSQVEQPQASPFLGGPFGGGGLKGPEKEERKMDLGFGV